MFDVDDDLAAVIHHQKVPDATLRDKFAANCWQAVNAPKFGCGKVTPRVILAA